MTNPPPPDPAPDSPAMRRLRTRMDWKPGDVRLTGPDGQPLQPSGEEDESPAATAEDS